MTTMKEWVRTHPYLALILSYVLVFVVMTGLWWGMTGRNLVDSAFTGAMWAAGYGIVAFFETKRRRKTNARLEEHGQIMAYIRYPDARPGSLGSIWNQGIATPAAGSLHFQPAVYDTLEPSGRAATISVRDVLSQRRKLSGRDRRYIQAAGIQALMLATDGGRVELAAAPESLDRLREVLGFRGAAAGDGS